MEKKVDVTISKEKTLVESPILAAEKFDKVEQNLNVILSNEFKLIGKEFRYDYLYHYNWRSFPIGVTDLTLALRKVGLPHEYIILTDEGDAGAIFLKTQDFPDKPSPVIWCDEMDVSNLCDTGEFKYNPTIWPSFTDFFEYLVEQEEKMQAEEG